MLEVPFLRQHTQFVKQRLGVKNFAGIELVDQIIALDDQRKKWQFVKDELLAQVNSLSKEIGIMMKSGNKEEAEQKN